MPNSSKPAPDDLTVVLPPPVATVSWPLDITKPVVPKLNIKLWPELPERVPLPA